MERDTLYGLLTKQRNNFQKKRTGFISKLSVTEVAGNHRKLCRIKPSPDLAASDYRLIDSIKWALLDQKMSKTP
jgi:hypothetical protein